MWIGLLVERCMDRGLSGLIDKCIVIFVVYKTQYKTNELKPQLFHVVLVLYIYDIAYLICRSCFYSVHFLW